MASSTLSTDEQGYPDRTFSTILLPCVPSSSVTFTEAGPSRCSGSEPFTKVRPVIASASVQGSLQTAAAHLQKNQLVSFPSETVYGLGANALSQSASAKIYAAKKRPADNPLIVHVSDLDMLSTLLPEGYHMSAAYEALVRAFWPGALTLLFPVDKERPAVPRVVTCGNPSVAVRMPSHPIARALIATSGLPMAGPSANASGRPSPTTAQHVMRDLGGELDSASSSSQDPSQPLGRLQYILDGGPCAVGVESTVVDGISAADEIRVLRPGGVTVEQIAAVLKEARLDGKIKLRVYGKDMERSAEQESNPTTPGMKYRHYSPTAKVVMLLPAGLFAKAINRSGERTEREEGTASTSAKVVESLLASEEAEETRPQTLANVIAAQLASAGSHTSSEDDVHIGLMTASDSPIARLLSSSSSPSSPASTATPATTQAHPHPHLLPPRRLESHPHVTVHPFDLGPSSQSELYAQRMFDGLRTLDEGPLRDGAQKCQLILVEALEDEGVGLAVMNRLKKAASETVVLDC